jgi:tetratricopeptide (TPR) repeat protein
VRSAGYLILGVLPSLCFISQCAARSPVTTPSDLAAIARADALVRDGCYRCLQDALGIYGSLTAGSMRRPPDQVLRGALEVSLLLAVREKELGLAPEASLTRARELLARLSPPGAPGRASVHADPSTLLAAAEAVAGDLSAVDSEERFQRNGRVQEQESAADAIGTLQRSLQISAGDSLIAAYLAAAIRCEQPRSRRPPDPTAGLTQASGPPLMQYRLAICSDGPPVLLAQLREADPRWRETFFFEGRYEMGSPSRGPDPERAAAFLTEASTAFPDSIGIALTLANAHDMNGDFAAALASFERVLARKTAHVDAQLGRVRMLSYLGRADEGIAASTALIDRGTWHVGDAYYWRAWNLYQTRRLEPAWSDIQQALRLRANTTVYALAGSIAYARRELETAVQHFDSAFAIDPTNCVAAWHAGLARGDQAVWPQAADRFSKATGCFAAAASRARTELTELEKSALDPARKARRVSSVRKRIESAEALGGQSALGAAQSFVHSGHKAMALRYVELAGRSPGTREKALALRSHIDRMR